MKSKFFILLLFGTLVCKDVDAQILLNLGGGYAENYVKQNSMINYGSTAKSSGGPYFYGHIKIMEMHNLSIFSGFELIEKNYAIYRYDMLSQRSKNLYLVLPLTIQTNIFKSGKFKMLGEVGLDLGYWTNRVVEGYIPNAFNGSYQLSSNGVKFNLNVSEYIVKNDFLPDENRIELSAKVGFQIQYRYNKIISPVFNLNYLHGLSSTSKNDIVISGKFNRSVVLSVGTLLKL